MRNDDQYYEITDAFLALKDIDDSEVENMLRKDRAVREGKSFSIQTGSRDLEAAKKFLDEEAESEDQIEVIDVDADTVDHLKKNTEYIGQGILCCNRCKANRFIDMDLLVASEADEEMYNIDDECPHCHDTGSGYTLIGQVGKVQKDEPKEETPEEAENEVEAEAGGEEEAKTENDEKSEDEATFENDLEAEEEPAKEEETVEEEPKLDTLTIDDEEDDGMETDTSEDELEDLDLPSLGDEVDRDNVKKDEDEDKVKESLTESVQLNALAEEAWMMNRVIEAMNNEEAYYGSWLYVWPDGETREECAYDFGDQESFDELKEEFESTYRYYHADGLYDADPEVLEYARKTDSRLGLAKIENFMREQAKLREAYECNVAGDVFNAITSPEKVQKIIILDTSDEEAEPRMVFKGTKEDLPLSIIGSPCKAFDVADGYLTCNVDSECRNTNRPLNKALECFNDESTDKVLVWDQATGEEVFSGTKADACSRFGDCEFISFETPAVVRICINNPSIIACGDLEDEDVETDVDKLIKKIIDANNLSQYKTDKPSTNEYWIKSCLKQNDDVELIYESFVKPLNNSSLTKQFKQITGYNNPLEEAYEAGFAAAQKAISRPSKVARRKTVEEAATSDVTLDQVKAEVDKADKAPEEAEQEVKKEEEKAVNEKLKLEHPSQQLNDLAKYIHDQVFKVTDDCQVVTSNKDGWAGKIAVMFDTTKVSIDKIKDITLKALADKHCEPEIVDTHKASTATTASVIVDNIKMKEVAYATRESVKSFKTRKELAEAVEVCKNNSQPYSIKRSEKDGFRYDLVTEDYWDDLKKEEHIPDKEEFLNIEGKGYTPKQAQLLSILWDTSEMLLKAIRKKFPSLPPIHPSRAMVEILKDFHLIPDSPDKPTTSIRELTDDELDDAIAQLRGPAFEEAAITDTVNSPEFEEAAKAGEISFIRLGDLEDDVDEKLEEKVCEKCGKAPCECVETETADVQEEMIDVDTEQFDKEMREYFDEAYENTVLYSTTDGHIDNDGTIVLEGLIQLEDVIKPITFTLTPKTKITESVEDKRAMLEKNLTETFTVTNNISEEKFEFKFGK